MTGKAAPGRRVTYSGLTQQDFWAHDNL